MVVMADWLNLIIMKAWAEKHDLIIEIYLIEVQNLTPVISQTTSKSMLHSIASKWTSCSTVMILFLIIFYSNPMNPHLKPHIELNVYYRFLDSLF